MVAKARQTTRKPKFAAPDSVDKYDLVGFEELSRVDTSEFESPHATPGAPLYEPFATPGPSFLKPTGSASALAP